MTFALSDEKLPDIVGLEPFPVPSGSCRRRVIGVDAWLEVWPASERVPRPELHAALAHTDYRLVDVAVVTSGLDAPNDRRLRARVAARRDDAHLTDSAVAEVLTALAAVGHWTLVRKLEEFDAIPAFPPIASSIPAG